MIKIICPERGTDPAGAGHFGARRGTRLHLGVDYTAQPESIVLSPVKGKVTKLGYPYGDDLGYRYVEVTDRAGDRHRLFYVEPLVLLDQRVKEGDKIGIVQDITRRYPNSGMKPHIHYEIKDENGQHLDPGRNW